MKRTLAIALSILLVVFALAGCADKTEPIDESQAPSASETPATQTPSASEAPATTSTLSGTVSTDGSTSMEKVIGILGESFMETNKGVNVTYNPTGSGSGIQAVSEGRCDIGLASRDLKEEEKATLTGTIVAIDGIAIIVNPANPVANLTIEQIAALYKGEITNWKDVGGADAPVVLIGREAGSGTRDGFESITDTEDACKYGQELTSTGDVIATVAGNPNAIGYASLSAVKDTVNAVTVNGVAPTMETVQDGSYKVQRNFNMVTRTGEKLNDAAQAFFDFATSADVDELIVDAGAVPVKH
jgi:phosphate transport system substrate-binding protein